MEFPSSGSSLAHEKIPKGNTVYAGLLHEPDILLQYLGTVQPLLRIIIPP